MIKCKACGKRTFGSTGYCQSCKSKRHHGYKRIKEENLLLDKAGGSYWIWNQRGDVIVTGKPTAAAAVIALVEGDVEDDDINESVPEAKTPAQLDREIKESLASTKTGRHHSTIKDTPVAAHKRLTKTQIQKLRVELRKAIKVEQGEAEYHQRYMNEDDYQRAGDNAIKAAGVYGKAAGQSGDNGVEIWEVVPGEGAVDDQIAEWHETDLPPVRPNQAELARLYRVGLLGPGARSISRRVRR
jgi:hypothetical protein